MRKSVVLRGVALVAVFLAALATSATSHATEDDAKTFFAEGRRARLAGDCAGAVVAFRRALDLFPAGLGSLRNIAECEEELGQFASSRKDWWELRRASLASDQEKYKDWDRDAEQAFNRLAAKVAKLTIKIEGTALERVHVSLDGKPVDPRLYSVALERDLGEHIVEAAYGGVLPIVVKRTLAEGQNETISIAIPPPGAGYVPRIVPPPAATDRTAYKVGGWVAAGVGVAGLAAAGVSLAIRQSALSEINATCAGHTGCSTSLQGARDRGVLTSTLFDVFGIAGIVGVGAAVPLLYVGYRGGSPPPRSGGAFGVAPTPGGAVARAEIAF